MRPRLKSTGISERATIICRSQECVLLVARTASRWTLPGGIIKLDESPAEAASRELGEETGLRGLKLAYAFQFVGSSKLHHVFVTDVPTQSDPRPGREISLCQWFRYVDVQSLPTSTPTPKIVERLYNYSCANLAATPALGV
ncbi:NUDIX hydrolase [Burkholderia lata]|uniref:NUDIX hydrolase n=1 Tax=Burkholderia lata (strain ATCC 17760 / DSM 23089 / LMG 22485 / NCIMB 9086 / R18194 / 383) TaxID=482957 RepID=UPI0015815EBE|nr:NUDIX hydrolase [Burkholderia lata]